LEITIDDNLTLKQISLENKKELFELVKSNEGKALHYWCPDLGETFKDLNSTEYHINDANKKYQEDKSPDCIIFEDGVLAGLISLSPLYENGKATEIGYWLGQDFEGRGLITRSFPALLDYAKNILNLEYVELSTSVPNLSSQKLPVKFNFREIKRVKDAEKLSDGMVDHILWRLEL
jgi:ribosomal-protein-serine acetyltransferase